MSGWKAPKVLVKDIESFQYFVPDTIVLYQDDIAIHPDLFPKDEATVVELTGKDMVLEMHSLSEHFQPINIDWKTENPSESINFAGSKDEGFDQGDRVLVIYGVRSEMASEKEERIRSLNEMTPSELCEYVNRKNKLIDEFMMVAEKEFKE